MKTRPLVISTTRLRLVAGTAESTKAAIENKKEFSSLLHATIPTEWPHELMIDAEPFVAKVLQENPQDAGWWVWYIILKGDVDVLIGSGGFGGVPTADGTVTMGWGLLDAYQGKGYATEAALAQIEWAFADPRVKRIAADTFPELKKSIRVMEKCSMTYLGAGPEEGTVRYVKVRK